MTETQREPRRGAGASDSVRRRPWFLDYTLLIAIPAVLALDQLSKAAIRATMELGQSWPAEGFFRITYGTNSGSAFGLFRDQTALLIAASVVAIAFLVFFYRSYSPPSALLRLAIGLQLGGAVGNLADRVRTGYVVDFIDVGAWPIFNVADSSIVVGMALLVTVLVRGKVGESTAEDEEQSARNDR